MLEFLLAEWWVPRSNCGYFPPWMTALYVSGQLLIFLAYVAIPIGMRRLRLGGHPLFDTRLSFWFKIFIGTCGMGHFLDGVVVFFWPHYMFFSFWHLLTATASWYTVYLVSLNRQVLITRDQALAITDLQDKAQDLSTEDLESQLNSLKARIEEIGSVG